MTIVSFPRLSMGLEGAARLKCFAISELMCIEEDPFWARIKDDALTEAVIDTCILMQVPAKYIIR